MVGLPIGADTTDYVAAVDDSPMAIYVAEEKTNRQTEDAVSALVNLGYPRVEAYRAVNLALAKNSEADFSSLIKSALKEFGSKEI